MALWSLVKISQKDDGSSFVDGLVTMAHISEIYLSQDNFFVLTLILPLKFLLTKAMRYLESS